MAGRSIVRRRIAIGATRLSWLTVEPAPASPTLVLIHGSGMSARFWRQQLEGIRDARVIAVDLPGHGDSDPISYACVDGYSDAVAAIVRTIGTDSAVLVGHSLGGAVAMTLAAREPAMVSGLVLVSSCLKLPPTDRVGEHIFSALPAPLRHVVFFAMARKLLFARDASAHAIAVGLRELRACRPQTIRCDVAAAKAMDVTDLAAALAMPTLVVCGSDDVLTPPALSRAIADRVVASRLVLIEGAGHMLPLETPAALGHELAALVASIADHGVCPIEPVPPARALPEPWSTRRLRRARQLVPIRLLNS